MAKHRGIAFLRPEVRPGTITGAQARGAAAIGALAVGAAAIGKLSVEELEIGKITVREGWPPGDGDGSP